MVVGICLRCWGLGLGFVGVGHCCYLVGHLSDSGGIHIY